MTYDGIRKKHTVGNDARVQSSKTSNNTFYEIRSKHRLGDEVDEDYINNYIRDFNSFSTNSKSDFDSMNYKNASSVYNKYRQAGNDLDYRATNIKGYLKANKDSIDPDTYQNLVNYLDESRNAISSTNRYFEKNNDFYSQWDTEEDYNKYIQGVEEREGMLTYDLEAGKNDINSLESQLDKLKKEKSAYDNEYKKNGGYIPSTSNSVRPSYAQVEPYKEWSAQSAAYQKKIDALEGELSKKKAFLNRAKHIQTADSLYNTALNAEDFESVSQKGGDNEVAQKRADYENKYGESFSEDYEFGEASLSLEDRFAKYANEDEMKIYSYYLGKGDTVSAQAFLTSMEETINARKAVGMHEDVGDNLALQYAFTAASAVQNFGVGWGNLFSDKDYYAPTATQMASQAVNEDLADVGPVVGGKSLGQIGYDLVYTTANMMPSILASSLVSYATGGVALGGAVGSISLGASAAGNAYAEMINLGYDKGQARAYSALVGGSEAGLQYLFGGVGKLGGKLTGKSVGAVVNNVDNAFAKAAIKYGGNMLSEGFEEYAQEILDPFFKNIAFNESNEINLFTPEALYSGVLGALSAGFLEGVPGAVNAGTNALKTYQTGKSLTKNKDFDVSRLVELGNTLSADSVAYKIADKVNENTGAYTIGKLFHSIGAELSAQNKADIVKSLTRKGVAESNANTIAEWLSAVVDGAKLTKTQIKALELNEDIANTFRDVVINKNSTFNQRRQAFFEAGGVNGYTGISTQAMSAINNPDAVAGRMESRLADSQSVLGSKSAPSLSDFEMQLSQFAHETANGDVPAIANDGPFIPTAKQPFVPARTVEKIKSIEGAKAKEHEVSSTEGKTILLENDEVVSIKRIASTEGKSMKLELSDGRIVSSKDVGYGSQGEALVYETVANMDVPVDIANSIMSMFDADSGQSATVFAKGIEEAYRYGYFSIPKAEMLTRASFAPELTDKQREDAYKLGSIMGKKDSQKSPKTAGKRGAVGKGKVHFDGDRKDLKPQQKAALDALEVIAEVTDMQIEVFESPVVNGRRVGENGSYDPKTGIMRIDLHAGISGNGLMLFTAAHEIGHHIKNWSPAKFKVLADFLMEQYAEKGVSVDELVKRQIAKAKANGRTLSYEEAYEEFVCDSLETMLADGAVIEKLKLLATKDKSLVQKMKSFLKDLVAKIKKAYAGLKPDSAEGKLVAEMVDATERLQNLFIEALMDATENYQSAGMQKLNDFTEAKTADGGNLLMQYRAIVADTDTYKQMLTEHNIMTSSEIDRLFDTVDKAVGIVKSNLEALDYAWDVWSDTEDIRAFKPVKNNSDKLYKYSLDFSTLCRKRILQGIIATQLQDALNRPLSKEESVAIRNELVEIQKEMKQIEVACALCYVESARMKAPKQIEAFLKDVEGNLRSFFAGMDKATTQSKIKQAEADARAKLHKEHPNGVTAKSGIVRKFNEEKFPLSHMPKQYAVYIRDAKRAVKDAYKPTKEELHLINVAKNMRVTDFTSAEGLENLAVNYPRIYDAYTSFIRNATHSKGIENDTWFRAGDTKDVPQTLIDAMNAENGFRTQSWSDFQVKHLLDYISAVIELSSRKAKMQTYTKVPDFVHLMGKTGMMINLSLIPQAKFNGSLEYDSVEGIDYETALKLRELYPETAGTICIGIKNEQIIKLLASEMIDYVIPYHHSGMSKAFRKVMKIPTWDSFEAYQNESKISDISEAKAQAEKMEVKLISKSDSQWQKSPSFSEWFDLEEAKQIAEMENATPSNMVEKEQYGVMYGAYKAMQNAANNYLKLCAERGLKPKFSAENADFTAEPNYWKLLIDRKMVNNKTGEIIEQKAVKPIFDQNEVLRILNEEVARYGDVKEQMNKATNLVVKKFLGGEMNEAIQAINKATGNTAKVSILNTDTSNLGGIKRSDRDSEGRELSVGQQEFFKDSKVRDENGNLKVVYHGTPDGDFNTFKLPEFFSTMMAAQGAGYYFTDKANATQYTKALAGKKAGKAKLFETYLNIKNPLVISDGSGVITKQQIIDVISKGNREWFFSSWINTALTTGTPETRLSKNEVASLSMNEKIDRYAEKISKYQDQDILAEMTRAFKGEAIIEAMESTFGTDGVKYTDRFGDIWVAWHPEQIKETTNKNPTSNLDVRYCDRDNTPNSFNTEGKTLTEQLNEAYEAAESFDQRYVYVGRFSNAFRELLKGKNVIVNDYPIAMNYRDAYLSMHSKDTGKYHGDGINYHDLGVNGLESALTSFESPKAIMMSKKQGKIELILQGTDKKGRTLLSIIAINTVTQNNRKFLNAHIVTSVYGRKSIEKYISNAENEGRLLLAKKEETSQGIPQVQYEGNINEISSKDSISDSTAKSQEKFSDRDIGYGKLTQGRIDYLIKDSGAGSRVDYARSWIANISPSDFINLTISFESRMKGREAFDERVQGDHGNVMGERDYIADLQNSRMMPRLSVDIDTGRVVGHDGRHRMRALEMAGARWTPVEIEFYKDGYLYKGNDDDIRLESIDLKRLTSQFDEEFYKQTHGYIHDIIPLNEDHRAEIEREYLVKKTDIRFSNAIAYSYRDIATMAETAEKHFGTTNDVRESGYITVNGKMLDFSGRHWGGVNRGSRQADHEDIGEILPDDFDTFAITHKGDVNRNGLAKYEFEKYGNIRTQPETGSIELAMMPTDKQKSALVHFFKRMRALGEDTLRVDINDLDKNGKLFPVAAFKYDRGTSADMIVLDIEEYYKRGKLPEGVTGFSESIKKSWMFSDRDPESTSPRNLLANALEGTVQNDVERKKLAEYKNKIDLMNAEEEKLTELRKQIKEASFSNGKRDSAKLKQLKEDATKTANRINTYDRQLLNLESTQALKNVLEREKKKATERQKQKDKEILAEYRKRAEQKQQDIIDRYQESRKKATEGRHKTDMRNKIKKVVSELNQYLLHGTKDKHVMIGMQKAVAEALSIVNMDTVGADDRVARYDALIAEATDPDVIESLTASRDRIKGQGDRLSEKLTSLQTAYSNIKDSSDPLVSNAYDEVIEAKIASVADTVGDTPLRDMSMSQLESVYDLYKMVLTNIRNANKLFKAEKQATIEEIGINVDGEIKEVTKQKDRMLPIMDFARKMGYKELKPIYFFRMLGSKTMTSLYESVRDGQNTWYRDAFDAKTFRLKTEKEYGYKKWDFKKKHSFEAKSGKTFDLTLSQIMSIYAFSRREQALDHLIKGGIVYDDAVKVKEKKKGIPISYMVNTSDAFNLSEVTLGEIIDTLSPEQKAFVETMQAYLSDTMGEKGNEVSLELYGVKMFKEKNYFPLKSSQYYMAFTAEEAGEVRIKNSSFSKETVKHANNPIVLSDFMDVWTSHVNDMAMYHAFVLPLEDFTRVYNYRTPTGDNFETTSIKSTIHNHFTESANEYIRQLLKDINGGSVSGVGTQLIDKMIGLAKKGAVFASASVVVQQPSAIARAMAYVNPKYFANFSAFNFARHNRLWEECKRYAPVAGIKEMGYFDTSVGRTGIDWIKSDEYETRREKFFAFLKDGEQRGTILDDILSKAPAMADELSWVALWEAVKKETKKTTDLKVGSEEFLEHCGKRFTEVIDLTQVYDSVFSRSELMRSKDRMVKAATAFMSEPTTQVNMLFDATLQVKRRGKKGLGVMASVVGSVMASVIVNSMLKSVVLAGRDDDDNETFLEKYLASFTGDVLNGLNPLTLIPFVKDVISIVQGYSVDRMDMSIVDALVSSVLDFGKDTKTDYEKWTGLLGSVSQLFGIPAKNIIRDINTAVNAYNTLTNGNETTKTGVKVSVEEGLSGTVTALIADKLAGVGFDTSKGKQYYDAVMSGDTAHASRIIAGYGDAKKADSAIVESLKNYEPRVTEAAQAQISGDNATRIRLAKEIIADGFKQDYVVKAINGMVTKLNKGEGNAYNPKAQSLYTKEDYFDAAYKGNTFNAKTYKEEILRVEMENNGKTREEAEKSFNNSFRSSVEDAVLAGELTADKATKMLTTFGGLDEDTASEKAQYYVFKRENPRVKYNWQSSTVADYNEVAKPNGINVAVFDDYLVQKSECTGTDTNGDGKTDSGSKKAQVLIVIDSLPISSSQKDTLYRMNGWAESKLYEAPWH